MQSNSAHNSQSPLRTMGEAVQNAKRKCEEISSEIGSQVGNMSTNDLLSAMSALLDEKLKNLPTKNDFLEVKNSIDDIKNEVNRLTNENQALKDEVQHLMEVREIDNRRINQMEENMGRKKLIIRGQASQRLAYEAV